MEKHADGYCAPFRCEYLQALAYPPEHYAARDPMNNPPSGVAGPRAPMEARVATSSDPKLGEFLDSCWAKIKAKLVRGLSIGFKSLEHTPTADGKGRRFLRYHLLEIQRMRHTHERFGVHCDNQKHGHGRWPPVHR
jgi:hypothetical protein